MPSTLCRQLEGRGEHRFLTPTPNANGCCNWTSADREHWNARNSCKSDGFATTSPAKVWAIMSWSRKPSTFLQGNGNKMSGREVGSAFGLTPGVPIWGLRRTHGSAIFIEFGEPIKRPGERVMHGEVHILSQLSYWRILQSNKFVVGSDSCVHQ